MHHARSRAGQASLVWSQTTRTEAASRSPGGTWSAPPVLASASSSSVATVADGAGNAIGVFRLSYSWHLAGRGWGPATPLPAGSSGATSFGTGTGSRGSLSDLKIVPGLAVILAANAVSTETVH
jgi:hypothetical protein